MHHDTLHLDRWDYTFTGHVNHYSRNPTTNQEANFEKRIVGHLNMIESLFTLYVRLPAEYCRPLFPLRPGNRCQTDRGYDATTTDTNAAFKTTEL